MTHVFVVDDTTFKIHLEYMFAGTGAGEKRCPFLFNSDAYMHHSTEQNLVSMIADISRIRVGDNIIFYLQANKKHEGLFFGVFKAASKAFFDENDDENNYLKDKLCKGLSFRVLIEPKEVYSIGITEHELLDDIALCHEAHRLCWSLIYRKLKGNRGCTMIMDYEYERNIMLLLSCKNKDTTLKCSGYTYDSLNCKIVRGVIKAYIGRKSSLDIAPRMYHKSLKHHSFEAHLQTYLVQRLSAGKKDLLDLFDINSDHLFWLGNEVSCGVGMQRIDIMIIQEVDRFVRIIPIELKDEQPNPLVFNQISWYVKWIKQYVVPNYAAYDKSLEIIPYIVAKGRCSSEFLEALKACESRHNGKLSILPCQYIEFEIDNNSIDFKKKA